MRPRSILSAIALIAVAAPASAGSGNFLLVRRDRPVVTVQVAEIAGGRLVYREPDSTWVTGPLDQCVALLNPDATMQLPQRGWLRLADGQRFPGEALSGGRASDDVIVWNQSSWLGRMEVPLDQLESVSFVPGAAIPAPGDADVLALANGDRLQGFVTALGDPVEIEVFDGEPGDVHRIELPLGRVSAVRMVTPPQTPRGRRMWLIDGTVVDADEIMLGDDGFFRIEGIDYVAEDLPKRIELVAVAAVLFDQQGLVPFASLTPRRVAGPESRYVVPEPAILDEIAPLGLKRVELRGPLTARYVLPQGATYLTAEAEMSPTARAWGDCDLIISDDGREIFSTRLNAASLRAAIAVPLHGSTLTIEITEGAAGPIQDQVILKRAMILVN